MLTGNPPFLRRKRATPGWTASLERIFAALRNLFQLLAKGQVIRSVPSIALAIYCQGGAVQ
jgi:hypothetical protein